MAAADVYPTNRLHHPELVSGYISRLARSQRWQPQPQRQIRPVRVDLVDQIDLPRPMPVLQLLLAQDRRFHLAEQFEVNEPVNGVARGEAEERLIAVLPHAGEEVGRDPDVKGSVGLAGKDVDARLALFPHGPNRAARWTLKQVQGDDGEMELEVFAPPLTQDRHPELVSGSIVPDVQVLQNHAAGAVHAFDAPAQTDGWTLKQVQGDGDFEVFG